MKKINGRASLGKGLSALIPFDPEESAGELEGGSGGKDFLPIQSIKPGIFQPRQVFASEELDNLADSIRSNGVINPIIVRVCDQGSHKYEIIAGERRWRAGAMAGLKEIPAIVRDISDKTAIEVAIIENVQREDLNPIEEAEAYKKLIEQYLYTHDDLSSIIGKSRSHITNMIRLLSLPKEVKTLLREQKITMGHARAMVNIKNTDFILSQVLQKSLNVRQTENLIKSLQRSNKVNVEHGKTGLQLDAPSSTTCKGKSEDVRSLEIKLSDKLGLEVEIAEKKEGGAIVITYHNLSELESLLDRLVSAN